MIVQFGMWRKSVALRIPRAYAKEIHAVPGGKADITIQNGSLVVTPIKVPVYTLDELLAGMTPDNCYGEYGAATAVGDEFGSNGFTPDGPA